MGNFSAAEEMRKAKLYQHTDVKVFNTAKAYYNDVGRLHRVDGPAVEYRDGSWDYYLDGHSHRDDGPAYYRVSMVSGMIENKYVYHLYGVEYMDIEYWVEDLVRFGYKTKEEAFMLYLKWR
jgi:hypothetical protein